MNGFGLFIYDGAGQRPFVCEVIVVLWFSPRGFFLKKTPEQILILVAAVISFNRAGLGRRRQSVYRFTKHVTPVLVVSKLVKARAGW